MEAAKDERIRLLSEEHQQLQAKITNMEELVRCLEEVPYNRGRPMGYVV